MQENERNARKPCNGWSRTNLESTNYVSFLRLGCLLTCKDGKSWIGVGRNTYTCRLLFIVVIVVNLNVRLSRTLLKQSEGLEERVQVLAFFLLVLRTGFATGFPRGGPPVLRAVFTGNLLGFFVGCGGGWDAGSIPWEGIVDSMFWAGCAMVSLTGAIGVGDTLGVAGVLVGGFGGAGVVGSPAAESKAFCAVSGGRDVFCLAAGLRFGA